MINNQGSAFFESNGDGSNDSTVLSDDPSSAGANEPTGVMVALPRPVVVPMFTPFGAILLALGLVWLTRRKLVR